MSESSSTSDSLCFVLLRTLCYSELSFSLLLKTSKHTVLHCTYDSQPCYWLSVKCYSPFMFMLLCFAFQCIPSLDLLLCSVSVNCFCSLTFPMSQFSVPGSYPYFKSSPSSLILILLVFCLLLCSLLCS